MKGIIKKDKGAVMIVEATIVFPIVFFVLFFLIFYGNIYYQKARIDSCVTRAAIEGASYCADPFLDEIESTGSVPRSNTEIQPYKSFSDMSDIRTDTAEYLEGEVKQTGFFMGMEPQNINCVAKYNNYLVYATYSVEVSYKIAFPISFLGKEFDMLKLSSRSEVPVSDQAEFIRNTNMAIDYLQRSEFVNKITETVGNKLSEIKTKIGNFFGN